MSLSRSFIVSQITRRSIVYFKLIFVTSIQKVYLHADVWCFSIICFEMTIFSECCCFTPLSKISWMHLCGCFIRSIELFVSSFTRITFSWLLKLHSEPWSLVASLLQLCSSSILCWLFWVFPFHYKLCNWFVNILKIPCWDFDWNCVDSVESREELTSWQYWVFLSTNMDHFFLNLVLLWFIRI